MARTKTYGNGPCVLFGREKGKKYFLKYIPGKMEIKKGYYIYINLEDATARVISKNIEGKLKW